MTIYVDMISPRLEYLVNFLSDFYNTPVRLTSKRPHESSFFINYTQNPLPNSIQIVPHPLLFEENIVPQNIEIGDWNNTPCFFKTQENATIDFDVFAACFYMISRYEEYLPFKSDAHQRFPATESLAFKNNFLEIPVVDYWLLQLAKVFQNAGGDFAVNRKYTFLQTVDIDKAYAYKHQAFPYNILLFLKAILDGKGAEYLLTLEGKKQDPFDVYQLLERTHKNYKVPCIYFILSGNRGQHDKNIPLHSAAMRRLLEKLKTKNELGLHPSYASFNSATVLNTEMQKLQNATQLTINKSRQHYLRFTFPDTFERLENIGITEEYSLGFADQPGFRAGTCTPFNFYNLREERESKLKLFPLLLMDVTLSRYLQLSKDESIERSKKIITQVKKVNGMFISLWHNSSFCELHNMEGWETVYAEMVKFAAQHD